MALIEVIKREKMLALSTRAVICLAILCGVWVAAVLVGTFTVIYLAGYWWFNFIVGPPLADGLARAWICNIRYCRPQWFKPEGA
ncbi:hypothetical protein [Pseudomonas sp. NPDC096950]|uniref:hypothetical protein n=1 Tax=Pseudomonas sp. NPDC096950 TaxID=3364485 RepID=UPI00383A932F